MGILTIIGLAAVIVFTIMLIAAGELLVTIFEILFTIAPFIIVYWIVKKLFDRK